ncbi:ATPase, T2SS/T4P/T4SS family [Pseudarthrobacter sp. J75]|uniref:CpaF family protein n=1 Tax=unclassified Pseudarthrobacter TaxID=2647000 RepID=UPI002E80F944|nr:MULTISPECIES: ATPase, T2SS/T4P/T4SS family [unclassified Pseudarthrobacter]MEE2521406.1 ATPase, T2SS/T4P/T4SS family [Pseudarthrobacter sp. J47]MEE2528638.1 ATPase, T2SS/T4P/T4SS family [Pseudarthrobacter sp. J75]MEE2568329.1 ATPase, T2SS/T4P/T4SS family [Pseudarthrobacter sp. J64]
MDAVRIVEDEVRELIRRRGLDPSRQHGEVRRLVEDAVHDYDERALLGPLPPLGPLEAARRLVFDSVAGYGPLQPLLDDPSIEEIWINAPHEIFVARNGESELTSLNLTDQQVRDLVERMLKSSGRRLDMSSPFVDAALPDGSRLHVVIPDVTRKHWAVNIRKFVVKASRLEHLVELGTLTPQSARFLGAAVASGLNILVSGATQAGKTTMLNCLAAGIGSRERVITVEEIFELQFPLRDVVGLQCRQPNLEGEGEIPLRRLVKEALRMRPDRLVVGEVREAESLDMLIALNSGLPGMCTVHANSAHDAVTKICTLPLLAGENISSAFVVPTVASCIDLVVHCSRTASGKRRVTEILSLGRRVENGIIESSMVFAMEDGQLVPKPNSMPSSEKFARAGYEVAALLERR